LRGQTLLLLFSALRGKVLLFALSVLGSLYGTTDSS